MKKLDEMFAYYADKGFEVLTIEECKKSSWEIRGIDNERFSYKT